MVHKDCLRWHNTISGCRLSNKRNNICHYSGVSMMLRRIVFQFARLSAGCHPCSAKKLDGVLQQSRAYRSTNEQPLMEVLIHHLKANMHIPGLCYLCNAV